VPAAQRFTATLQQARGEGGRWLKMPFDAREVFGQARPPVRGTINGTPMRARLSAYGGETYLGLRREIRDAAGIEVGDDVEALWVGGAKRKETREKRAARAVDMLRDGIKHP